MAVRFGISERRVLSLFAPGADFRYLGEKYIVEFSGKPVCHKGEPKTDVYVLANSANHTIELKISFKQADADFLENKTNAERAEQLLGPAWSRIISAATKKHKSDFLNRYLIFKNGQGKTRAGSITLGWKFELMNVKSGELSGLLHLTREQVIDVYAGTHLSSDKRDASVNGRIIRESGIANCILFEDEVFRDVQAVVDELIPIEDYVNDYPEVYFACKALNFRTFENKYDGNRPLSVYVDWSAADGVLTHKLIFDSPLEQGGDYVHDRLYRAMRKLGIRNTDDILPENVDDPGIVLF